MDLFDEFLAAYVPFALLGGIASVAWIILKLFAKIFKLKDLDESIKF